MIDRHRQRTRRPEEKPDIEIKRFPSMFMPKKPRNGWPVILLACLVLIGSVQALSTSYSIAGDIATVTYDFGSMPHEGRTVQLYHMDYNYPVAVAEWDAVSSSGTVSINLAENKIPVTTFFTRIVETDADGNIVEVIRPWWWFW